MVLRNPLKINVEIKCLVFSAVVTQDDIDCKVARK